jgi:hypothetical protein
MRTGKQLSLHATCWFIFFFSLIFADSALTATLAVTSTSDSGPGSFRQAILDANANDLIVFDQSVFPPTSPATITLLTALPDITVPITIDGTDAGVELDGTNLSAGDFGFRITSGGSTIRGLVINRFKGSSGGGIFLGEKGGNVIQRNYIGTDISGSSAAANYWGIDMESSDNNTIGGPTPGEGNVISGNRNMGFRIDGSDNNVVQGNFIGTDATGSSALGNGNQGIWISNSNRNTIGGMAAGEGNVISSNADVAVRIGFGSNNQIYGNIIGLDVSKTVALGNSGGGVHVFSGANNGIRSNSIFSNGQLGIDLDVDGSSPSDGVTPNDPGDQDVGPNNLQNFPELNSATLSGSATIVQGSINSMASSSYTIEFFCNTTCDPSGNGEGQMFLGSTLVVTDGSGNATINESLPSVAAELFITATATDLSNNTSEFSACVEVTPQLPKALPQIYLPLLSD